MGRRFVIALFSLLALSGCHDGHPEGRQEEAAWPGWEASPTLLGIDSLMPQRPDSALALLCGDVARDDTATRFDRHYRQLLLAEALYKNDYAQTDREAVMQATAYFDSLVRWVPPFKGVPGRVGDSRHVHNRSDNIPYLSARAHYINGVGFYEQDSAVAACREYLTALETMESRFGQEDLVGEKAKFMALACSHLTDLFSDHYLHEQAIYFGKLALEYYGKYDATAWHVGWIYNTIGSHYDMMERWDSAYYYYSQAEHFVRDTTLLLYRDIEFGKLSLSYKAGARPDEIVKQMHGLVVQSESQREYIARCLTVGEIHYHESQLDTARAYLDAVFQQSQSTSARKQAAEWLFEICKHQGRDDEALEYARYLAPFATASENQGHVKSQLAALCHQYEQERSEIEHRKQMRKLTRYGVMSLSVLATLVAVFISASFVVKRRHSQLKAQGHLQQQRLDEMGRQMEAERHAHRMQQAALAGRLKRSNDAIRKQTMENEKLLKALEAHQKQSGWGSLGDFLNESICKEILHSLHNKDIKRDAKNSDYSQLKLSLSELSRLDEAVERHFKGFVDMLTEQYPRLSKDEKNQCLLYLLNLEDVQIAHLLACDYSTVKKRAKRLKESFNTEKELGLFIRGFVL